MLRCTCLLYMIVHHANVSHATTACGSAASVAKSASKSCQSLETWFAGLDVEMHYVDWQCEMVCPPNGKRRTHARRGNRRWDDVEVLEGFGVRNHCGEVGDGGMRGSPEGLQRGGKRGRLPSHRCAFQHSCRSRRTHSEVVAKHDCAKVVEVWHKPSKCSSQLRWHSEAVDADTGSQRHPRGKTSTCSAAAVRRHDLTSRSHFSYYSVHVSFTWSYITLTPCMLRCTCLVYMIVHHANVFHATLYMSCLHDCTSR